MSEKVTLFTTCKPFRHEFAAIQRNAMRSWSLLDPQPPVVVFGNEDGVREICEQLGFRHIGELDRTQGGAPLLNGLFEAAERYATTELLAYLNADIILTHDFAPAVQHVSDELDRFLLIGRRWNLSLKEDWSFEDPAWEERLREVCRARGVLEPPYGGVDLFAYRRGLWGKLPPFAIGRGRWDSALIYYASRMNVPVVDATASLTCVHQDHDYSHHPDRMNDPLRGPDAQRNDALLGGPHYYFTALNATHVLGSTGLRRQRILNPAQLLRRAATLPGLHPRLAPLAPLVRWVAPVWRRGRRPGAAARSLLRRVRAGLSGLRPGSRPPSYPTSIRPRPISKEVPAGGGVETFDSPEALRINRARLEHLESLGLPLNRRRVLDVGCGVGHLAQFFVQRNCDVVCVDGRQENIERLRLLYPRLRAEARDLDNDPLTDLGPFDVVFSYGVLYHLENPFRALRNWAALAADLLLIETVVTDSPLPIVAYEEETSTFSQALRNVGCRPSPSFVVLALRAAGFSYVYVPRDPPDHPDFRFRWNGDLSWRKGGSLLRCIFVASREAIANPALATLLP
jgi:SAM-dependent methyltransferase